MLVPFVGVLGTYFEYLKKPIPISGGQLLI